MYEEQLNPCPICGELPHIADFEISPDYTIYQVYCMGKDCTVLPMTMYHPTRAEAIRDWNERTRHV